MISQNTRSNKQTMPLHCLIPDLPSFLIIKLSLLSHLPNMPTSRAPPLCSTFLCFLFISLCQSDDLETLLSLKLSIRSTSNPGLFNSWNPANSVCDFAGVSCNFDGLVTQIDLPKQGLTGTLPFNVICKLRSLEKLTLGDNFLSGEVRPELNKCVQLVYLDLGQNSFSGSIPDISSLSRLEHLYLNHSGFSGPFPWSALSNMTSLTTLSLGDNPFDPTDTFPPQILKLKKLRWVFLSNCSIHGTIPPEIGDLSELMSLELSDNHLTGIIPPEMAKLQNLWQLELYRNKLTGKLPYGFRNLTNLVKFDASTNHLQGDLSELRFLTKLDSLQMYNNQFTGEIPAEFGMFKQLVNISLYANKLTGSLPQKLGSWSEFGFIDVSENYLTGPIPPHMCNKGTMFALLMLQNNITGPIPESYGNCTSLERFRVSNNLLSGTVPAGIWGLPLISIIDISSNQLEGIISSTIGKAKALTSLRASNNKLSGELPPEITSSTSLQAIDLQNNQISGGLPNNIGKLKELSTLYVQKNELTGSIPESLGSCSSLNDLNIAENLLTGRIPSSLGSLPTLDFLNLSGNKLSGSIPESLSSLRLSILDLSNNRLTGRVPQSLSIEAYNGSFAGNAGLCSQKVKNFQPCSSSKRQLKTLIMVFVSALLILLVALSAFIFQKRFHRRREDQERSLKRDSWNLKSFHVLTFTEDDVLDSVKQENLIGKGRSGNVYRLALPSGKDVAVKHIWTNNNNGDSDSDGGRRITSPMLGNRRGKQTEFEAEVEMLSSIRHVNVVKLYCSITSEDSSLLVCEYMPGGSLWDQIHCGGKCELDWVSRHEIALGSAKGLEYLHHGLERPVIHRDVKSSNILLDEFLKPRIADFGLAKMARAKGVAVASDSTHVIAGTLGYIAPEYGYTHKVNEKSDVYSFGVVLMELVTGKRPIEPEYGENRDIVYWVCSKVKTRESVLSLVDSRIADGMKEEAIKVLRIAILCTGRLPTLRPTMRSVVQMLEESEPCKLSVPVDKDAVAKQDEEDLYGKKSLPKGEDDSHSICY